MKNKILVSIILFSLSVCSVQASQCVVDPRYEFVSIVWRLVGVNEYNKCQIPAYCEAIDSYFEPYKSDTLLMHCVQIRRKHRIAYDAIASATAVLEIKHNRIKVIDGFSVDSIATIDKRWTPEAFKEYVRLLDKFYRKSKFNKFFVSQRPLYAAAEAAADSIIFGRDVDLTWFKKFFGQELSSYKVFLSINNGYCNYGGLKEPGVNVAALLGGCYLKEGVLSYNDRVAEILTHEFMHAFANPLAVKYKTGFDTITDKIYPFVAPMLHRVAYDKGAIMYEWFTRISTIMYERDNFPEKGIDAMIVDDSTSGFVWQRDAIALMDLFNDNRAKYETFESFVPELHLFLDTMHIENYLVHLSDTVRRVPAVVSITPAQGSHINMAELDTFVVEVKFSEPMQYSICAGPIFGVSEEEFIEMKPQLDGLAHYFMWVDHTTFVAKIPKAHIELMKCRGVQLKAWAFLSMKDVPMKENVELTYKFDF